MNTQTIPQETDPVDHQSIPVRTRPIIVQHQPSRRGFLKLSAGLTALGTVGGLQIHVPCATAATGTGMLISVGAVQSNHCRQTAAAARFGLECVLVLTGGIPQPPSANLLLDRLFGARIVNVADRKDRGRALLATFDDVVTEGKRPYLVPYGGSSPTGALGYAYAIQEFQSCHDHPPTEK